MEAATAVPEQEQEEQVVADAQQPNASRFKWSKWVHVGDGAEECEHRFDGHCEAQHFHAWIRLPNPFQHRDINEKAQAAKARRLRTLRDEESDPRVILEGELADLISAPRELLIEEILDKDWPEDYQASIRVVDSLLVEDAIEREEDEDVPRRFAGIDQHREEYERQSALPEEQRGDDYAELQSVLAEYGRELDKALAEIQKPKKERLEQAETQELIDIIRRDRIQASGTEAFLHTYNAWTWFVCTFKPRQEVTPTERVWSSLQHMRDEAEADVVTELRNSFQELEHAHARSNTGNS